MNDKCVIIVKKKIYEMRRTRVYTYVIDEGKVEKAGEVR